MTIDALLAQLAALDVVLAVTGDRVRFDGPAGALTAELRAELVAHKPALIERLSGTSTAATVAEPIGAERFAGWVPSVGADGRLGWEPPDLPNECRWWARRAFEALPRLVRPWSPLANDNRRGENRAKQTHQT